MCFDKLIICGYLFGRNSRRTMTVHNHVPNNAFAQRPKCAIISIFYFENDNDHAHLF